MASNKQWSRSRLERGRSGCALKRPMAYWLREKVAHIDCERFRVFPSDNSEKIRKNRILQLSPDVLGPARRPGVCPNSGLIGLQEPVGKWYLFPKVEWRSWRKHIPNVLGQSVLA